MFANRFNKPTGRLRATSYVTRIVGSLRAGGRRVKALIGKRAVLKRLNRGRHYLLGNRIRGPKTLADNIRFFANPGPHFELADRLDATHLPSRAKTIAFYLPQFHAFEENNEWWGEGFTEWRNVARGTPRFAGHFQPRVPRDLGFYDLSRIDTIKAQSELAKQNGIEAFCFYYYWFNGKRLMEKPLDLLLESDIDQPFCIMWANENWTRTWDGLESDVLIQQDYRDQDEDAFIADTAKYMLDERYVRVAGQPLFILYRPGLLPDAKTTIARWRRKWHEALSVTPLVMMVQGFGEDDPRVFGLDGAVEFPPHKVCAGLKNINDRCRVLDSNFNGLVRDYKQVVNKSLSEPAPDYPLIKTVSPHWDNDARREGLGMVMYGSTPSEYQKWLNGAINFSIDNPVQDESIVFINAWNEWAEGAYLEPDVHFGHAYLNASKRAIKGLPDQVDAGKILLLGHDAHKHGAQMLLLNMARTCVQQFGMDVLVVLKEGGALLPEYKRVTKTVVLNKSSDLHLKKLVELHDIKAAICNTAVTGDLVPTLGSMNVRVVSLIHEMPNLLKDYKLEHNVEKISKHANHVVFAAECVQQGFEQFCTEQRPGGVIRAQGTYAPVTMDVAARARIRDALKVGESDRIVLGVGYADLRKGFDLFMETARRLVRDHKQLHFVWVGAISSDMQRWVQNEFVHYPGSDRIHIIGFTDRASDYYSASDCLYLSSREDPYPTVVLEAMNVGLPVMVHRGTSGFDSLMKDYGYCVDMSSTKEVDEQLLLAVSENSTSMQQKRIAYVETHCQFDDYCFDLLQLVHPNLQKVSVAIPSSNSANHLEQRLVSIFSQSYPLFEIALIDNASNDDSVDVARRIASKSGRRLRVVANETPTENVLTLWQQCQSLSRGNLLWMATANTGAKPEFLEKLVAACSANTTMAFCESQQMQKRGEHVRENHGRYMEHVDPTLFQHDVTMPGDEFAVAALSVRNTISDVGSVLWNKEKLGLAMHKVLSNEGSVNTLADWRLYLEVLAQEQSKVAYVANILSHHDSETHGECNLDLARQRLAETLSLHQWMLTQFNLPETVQQRMSAYTAELHAQTNATISGDAKVA